MNAATQWIKWSKDMLVGPSLGEWCLWTMVIRGQRNYFGGQMVQIEGKLFLVWDGFASFEPDDTVYFARVNHLQIENSGE